MKFGPMLALAVTFMVMAFSSQSYAGKKYPKKDLEKMCTDLGGIYHEDGDGEFGCWLPGGEDIFCLDYINTCVLIENKKQVAQKDPDKKKKYKFLKSKFKVRDVKTYEEKKAEDPGYRKPSQRSFSRFQKMKYKKAYMKRKIGSGTVVSHGNF